MRQSWLWHGSRRDCGATILRRVISGSDNVSPGHLAPPLDDTLVACFKLTGCGQKLSRRFLRPARTYCRPTCSEVFFEPPEMPTVAPALAVVLDVDEADLDAAALAVFALVAAPTQEVAVGPELVNATRSKA